eukprot:TRINITY_DN18698_c0_g1_i1.p1 TRINITY_DN18698_c0_g1~~TRINITY_DN18698_c0_g1_i1.p1  ORF type:complete len:416 (+),score=127.41 TRINITY_DN18698_c0_g1_i1:77-1249(+)
MPQSAVTEQHLLKAARRELLLELEQHVPGSVQARGDAVEPQADRQTLTAFFSARDPDKLPYVDEILTKFKGREPTMYEHLMTQYRVKRTNRYRDEIIKYYERHNPARICAVDVILDLYEGREDQLMFLLVNKYRADSPLRVWCRYVDSGTGREYFHNRITQEVQWAVPKCGYLIDSGQSYLIPLEGYAAAKGAQTAKAQEQQQQHQEQQEQPPPPQPGSAERASPPQRVVIMDPTEVVGAGSPEELHGTQPQSQASLASVLHPKMPPPTNVAQRGVPGGSASPDRYRAPAFAVAAPQPSPAPSTPTRALPPRRAPSIPLPTQEDMCVCEVCNKVCSGFEALAAHKEEAGHGAWYPCGVDGCPFQFPSNHSLLLHRLQMHEYAQPPQPASV